MLALYMQKSLYASHIYWNVAMNYAIKIFILAMLAVSLYVSPNLASSQSDTFSVVVNKPTYVVGETVIISGTVPLVVQNGYVAIQVFNPRMTPYAIDQVIPAADETYSTAIKMGGKLGISGLYTVKVTYFGNSVVASFELLSASEVESSIQNIKVEVEDQTFDVLASLTNGSVLKIDLEPDFKSLTVSIQTSVAKNGTLQITLPRDLIDAREGPGSSGIDKSFMVLVGGKDTRFNEIDSTATARTLAIPVLAGAQTVEIIGTVTAPLAIPEFDIITVLVLGIAMAATIALRHKLQASSKWVAPKGR